MNINDIVKQVLNESAKFKNSMILTEEVDVTKNLKYHLDNQIPLFENVFRSHSDAFFDLMIYFLVFLFSHLAHHTLIYDDSALLG